MDDNSTLRYLGEAYEGVRFHVEPLWAMLGSDVEILVYLAAAAAAFAAESLKRMSLSFIGRSCFLLPQPWAAPRWEGREYVIL